MGGARDHTLPGEAERFIGLHSRRDEASLSVFLVKSGLSPQAQSLGMVLT